MGALFTQPYGGTAALWGRHSLSPIGGAVRSVLLGALQRYGGAAALWGTQPYRGRRSLSAIGALRRYGAFSPIGGAAALWGRSAL